jgi:hypothetical protein
MTFVRHCLSRVNPVLAPRRKRETAERHLRAVRLVNRWLDGMMASQRDAVWKWAAGVILDAGSASRNTCPPGFGSTVWDAEDGVLKYTLKLAAEYLLRDQKQEDPIIDRAFAALWPEIWLVCHSYGVPTAEQWAAALATMEMIDPPMSIFWIQVHGSVDEIKPLAEFLGLPIPEPEGNNGTFPVAYEDGDNITRGEEDGCVITIQRAAPISPDIMDRIAGHASPIVAPHVHVDTMSFGFEHQPQYRGPANGLAAVGY